MTIEGHDFGLTARPFQLTPNPDLWFESATHRKAMAYLSYGLTLGEGVIVITGEIGAGKTTLLGHLLQTLDRARVAPVELCPADLIQTDPVTLLARALCTPDLAETADGDPSTLVRAQIAAYARMGKRLLLIIDEAQGLSAAALDQLRLISDAGPSGPPVVQLLLLGQPEFRDTLETPALEQLRQRIIAAHHLTAMLPDEVKAYIEHRLTHAGWQGRPAITDGAAQAIADLTQGLPRKINQLMTRVWVLASLTQADEIAADMVAIAHREMVAEGQGRRGDGAHMPSDIGTAPACDDAAVMLPDDLEDRLARIEARMAEQDVVMRQVLNLLIDWVEGEATLRSLTGTQG